MDKVTHFEIPAEKLERAKKFYKNTFGWKVKDFPEVKYTMLQTSKSDKMGMSSEMGVINGGMMMRDALLINPVITIEVADMGKRVKDVMKNGGKIVIDPMEVMGIGWTAYFKDTEGNIMGLFQRKKM